MSTPIERAADVVAVPCCEHEDNHPPRIAREHKAERVLAAALDRDELAQVLHDADCCLGEPCYDPACTDGWLADADAVIAHLLGGDP